MRLVREAKDLPAAIVEPHTNVEVALGRALAQGRSRDCTAHGAHRRSGATTTADCSSEEPADNPAEHRSAHWITALVDGGLPDPGHLTQPLGGRCHPGDGARLGRGAGCDLYEHHCCEATVQVDLPSRRTGRHQSLATGRLATPSGTTLAAATDCTLSVIGANCRGDARNPARRTRYGTTELAVAAMFW